MRNVTRPAILVSAAVAAVAVATPAFATTHLHPTSLNARATKHVVAPRHTDTINLTLREGKKGVAGEAGNFLVRMRRDNGTAKWHWATPDKVSTVDKGNGHYTVTVTMPPKIGKGQKEQYQVKFAGDSAKQLRASRSHVITLKAS